MSRRQIFKNLMVYCSLRGLLFGLITGGLLGLPILIIGVFPGAFVGGVAGMAIGILTGLTGGGVTVAFFYPPRNASVFRVTMALVCIGSTCLSVTLTTFGFFHWDYASILGRGSTFFYYYYFPMAIGLLISYFISGQLTKRYYKLVGYDVDTGRSAAIEWQAWRGLACGAAVCLFAAGVAIVLYWSATIPPGPLFRWLIPQDYVGWVETDFQQADAPAASTADGRILLVIPPNGLLRTSSDINLTREIRAEYYYYDMAGKGPALSNTDIRYSPLAWGMIWDEGQHLFSTEKPKTYEFFVGTESQYNKMNESDAPITIGPISTPPAN